EVKRVSPNDNYGTLETELQIAYLRWPEVFGEYLIVLEPPEDRTVSLASETDALAMFVDRVRDAVRTGENRTELTWRSATGTACTVGVEIRRVGDFDLIGTWRPMVINDLSSRSWLDPYACRVRERAIEALDQMRAFEERTGMRPVRKDVIILYAEPGGSSASV